MIWWHAKRNEFRYGDRPYLVNGGTLNVDPRSTARSPQACSGSWAVTRYFEKNRDMFVLLTPDCRGAFFDRESFGQDKLVVGYADLPSRRLLLNL